MSSVATLEFHLREGWTLRKVATALVREWLPPLKAEPAPKGARWTVHSVVEAPGGSANQLWEPGISTHEYEQRLDGPDISWAIRASTGRGNRTILARFAMSKEQPETVQVSLFQASLPEALFDPSKVDELLNIQGTMEAEALFAALLVSNGFQLATN